MQISSSANVPAVSPWIQSSTARIMYSTKRIKNRKGFYTFEAVLFLPLVILAVISIGYFIRLDATWENVMHCAIDESAYSASKAYGSISELDSLPKIRRRILQENELLYSLKIRNVADNYSDGSSDGLTRYSVHTKITI